MTAVVRPLATAVISSYSLLLRRQAAARLVSKIRIFSSDFCRKYLRKGLSLAVAVPTVLAMASGIDDIIKQADEMLEKNEIQEAFDLLKPHKDSDVVGIQWRFARMCYRLGKYHTPDKSQAKELAALGLVHADKAIALDENCYPAYRWKGVILNWSTEFEGYKVQIEKSFEVRTNFDKSFELNPDASTKHLIGRWCYEVANVPWYMRKAAQYIFATPPSSTYEEALQHFEEAEKIDPGFYSANWLYIGKCYQMIGDKAKARQWLEKAAGYKRDVLKNDDLEAIDEAKKLLAGL